jgi:feruloyl esterase
MTVKAKAVVQAFYGSAARRSYWNGCSTGGRQALKEAQMFPEDFDGIIAGAPGNRTAMGL